jgi:hypothetical protein
MIFPSARRKLVVLPVTAIRAVAARTPGLWRGVAPASAAMKTAAPVSRAVHCSAHAVCRAAVEHTENHLLHHTNPCERAALLPLGREACTPIGQCSPALCRARPAADCASASWSLRPDGAAPQACAAPFVPAMHICGEVHGLGHTARSDTAHSKGFRPGKACAAWNAAGPAAGSKLQHLQVSRC